MFNVNEEVYEIEVENNIITINGSRKIMIENIYDSILLNLINNTNVNIITINSNEVTDNWLSLIDNFNNVKIIKIVDAKITDKSFFHFSKYDQLYSLSLVNCNSITGSGIYYIVNSTIDYLDLSNCSIDKYALTLIAKMSNLKLCLDNTKISYNDLMKLTANNTIKVITKGFFSKNQIENLTLKQIYSSAIGSAPNIKKYEESKKRLLEFLKFISTLDLNIYMEKRNNSNCYVYDYLKEYVDDILYNKRDFFISYKYDDIKILTVDEYNGFIRIYIQDIQNINCFKRFILSNKEKYKIVRVEELDCGWKEISL